MQDKYWTIHFEDKGTGECSDDFVFLAKEDLHSHWAWDYPGYGCMWEKEIDRKTALEMIYVTIHERVDDWADDHQADTDGCEYEKRWFIEAEEYIRDKEPGWQLLEEEMKGE